MPVSFDAGANSSAAHRAAARLPRAIHGNCYWTPKPAAEGLENKEPPASLLYRRIIDFTLDHGRSKRYGHAARHLLSCARLASLVPDWQGHRPHADYAEGVRQRHHCKSGFWTRVDASAA